MTRLLVCFAPVPIPEAVGAEPSAALEITVSLESLPTVCFQVAEPIEMARIISMVCYSYRF